MVARKGQHRRTLTEQIAAIYGRLSQGEDVRSALEHAFDVEAVTKRFFVEYRRVFDRVMALVEGLPAEDERKVFCQTLFNRLMFLYFLQRKGWLRFAERSDYLEALWQDARTKGERGFFENRLKLLFFAALNNERTANFSVARSALRDVIGRVPFLNGGLFEQTELDKRAGVTVPDEAIRLILLELFGRFNFTVTESTPYDVEVAVDPEMLGKVFEELVTGRHETGSYYTPRPIVAFMCREALKHHLQSRVDGLSTESTSAFVDAHDVSRLTVQQARQIIDALATVTVLDPACGSGAYPLGMMHELVDLQRLLYSSELMADSKSLYELKLQVIERNLYGADIDPFAVNIAMLRLWLSLIVEYEGPGDPPALPNLDFKIVCGDSLTAADPSPEHESDLFRQQIHVEAAALTRLKAEYLRETGDAKRIRGDQIREKQASIASLASGAAPPGAVDWRVEFAEVFDDREGFDIIIANPPYVRMELFKDQKPQLRRNFAEVHTDRADLYVYFYARALQLLRDQGALAFISSNKWLRAGYGKKLRRYLGESTSISTIVDFGDLPVFQAATAYPVVIVVKKHGSATPTIFTRVESLGAPYPDIRALVAARGHELPRGATEGTEWILADAVATSRISAMMLASIPLGQYVDGDIFAGIKTGRNSVFVISRTTRDSLVSRYPQVTRHIKPFLFGRSIQRWRIEDSDTWVIFLHRGSDSKEVAPLIEYLRHFRDTLESRASSQEWYEIQQPQVRYSKAFDSPKSAFD